MQAPIVYDVGMSQGEDSSYYLAKGCRVIAIDANKDACRYCTRLFDTHIKSGQMTIINAGVSDEVGEFDFFVNLRKERISTFAPEMFSGKSWAPALWRADKVKTFRLPDLVLEYGSPDFIKIDVEYYDARVLLDLCQSGIRPRYISAECHDMACFETLVKMGYKKFRLVYGKTVAEAFGRRTVRCIDGSTIDYEFGYESSGPYGDDLPGPWLTEHEAFNGLASSGLDWVDVHACF